jgi:CRISPR-associated endonuclease/helicase Cas3
MVRRVQGLGRRPAGEELLAHSPRGDAPAQTYAEHVEGVHRDASHYARCASVFYSGDREAFVEWVSAAATYHDLGKLDDANQGVLRRVSREGLPVPHEDAGVAALDRLGRRESVVLVAGHHAGLFGLRTELSKQGREFRRLDVVDLTDESLDHYLDLHRTAGCSLHTSAEPDILRACGFTRRIALSCLVDADHGNTAEHYGEKVSRPLPDSRWAERSVALQRYVDRLPAGKTEREQRRNGLRRQVFEACRDAPVEPHIRACDAPVGSGKTTAVMAHLLRVADDRKLRHIFVVLPYTNIISQAVEVYRKALVLEGERPEEIVAEHHHRADFEETDLRQYATLWRVPIIVTTAVQFFETLGSHNPSRLRKLHELPGSAVFVDEMHAAIPSHLWPQVWRWLETWTRDWGGHLVMASGSLARFWELPEYRELIEGGTPRSVGLVSDLVSDGVLKGNLREAEERRIAFLRRPEGASALDCLGLIDFLKEKRGPRLLIVNTVQTAAVVARCMRDKGHDVLHLSTALAPAHRDLVVGRIKQRLRDGVEGWTLVATSCVEAGMDFSFRSGFRERASTASLIQIGGRVSRGDEHDDAEVWDLLLRDDQFRPNPAVEVARNAVGHFSEDELNRLPPADLATQAMRREWTAGADDKARHLVKAEHEMEYPEVANRCRVIEADTVTVVIDPGVAQAVRRYEKVSKLELLRFSVQIWAKKTKELALLQIGRSGELYEWQHAYDPAFLGYMAGVLQLERYRKDPEALIL